MTPRRHGSPRPASPACTAHRSTSAPAPADRPAAPASPTAVAHRAAARRRRLLALPPSPNPPPRAPSPPTPPSAVPPPPPLPPAAPPRRASASAAAHARALRYAVAVFSSLSSPDPCLAAAILRFAHLTQPPLETFRLFSSLRRAHGSELPLLPFAFSPLVKSAAAARSLPAAAAAHAVSILLGGFHKHRFVENSLIGSYVACCHGRCLMK
ncbi:hypothetical protein BS78_10G245600 [Paspalum vaginatum]|nr:hypothetical protein BS78_10G245600 [Paspalum vaginatum]